MYLQTIKTQGVYFMKKNIFIISVLIFFNIGFMQNAELVTQKIKLENAMRDKINTTVINFTGPIKIAANISILM